MDSSLRFYYQFLWKLIDWFSCDSLFDSHILSKRHWVVITRFLSQGDNLCFKYCLVLLLIITFSSRFVWLVNFSRHLCSYIAQLLNDWSNTMVTMCCFSSYDCNNHLINDIFLLKWVNLNNWINHFSLCTWFVTLCSMGTLPWI